MAEPFEITDEAIESLLPAFRRGLDNHICNGPDEVCCDRAGLAAAAPLIAAQALRQSAGELRAQAGTSWGLGDVVIWLQRRAEVLERGTDQ